MKTFFKMVAGMFIFLVIGNIAIAFINNLFKQDKYKGFVYTDGCSGCSGKYLNSEEFKTSQECLSWVYNRAAIFKTEDFECGKNCRTDPKSAMLINICDETFQ